MKRAVYCLLFLAFFLSAQFCRAAEYVWLEGESPTSSNYKDIDVNSFKGNAAFSNGQWARVNVGGADLAKLPKDGIVLNYDFTAPSDGKYQVWNHVGYEAVRSPFDWRIDNGEWKTMTPKDLTIDLVELTAWNEVAWLDCGEAQLTKGKHTFQIRLQPAADAKKLLYCSDAICLMNGEFHPNGKYKPDENYQNAADKAAADKVYDVKADGSAADRIETSLDGQWQFARYDELDVDPKTRTEPIQSVPDVNNLFWYSISVPGDRNKTRPDMAFSHRYFLRTRVAVPADLKGRSFHLHFQATSLIASVFVNGKLCGTNDTPLAPWDCDITSAVKPGQNNEICIGFKDSYYAYATDTRASFNAPFSTLHYQGQSAKLDFPVWGRIWTGLYQPVTFITAGQVYTSDVFVQTSVKNKSIKLSMSIENPTDAAVTVNIDNICPPIDPGNVEKTLPVKKLPSKTLTIPANSTGKIDIDDAWANPTLWWPDAPFQYDVITTLSVDGKPVDIRKTKFGFREWTWDHAEFTLNGVPFHGRADLTLGATPEATLKLWHDHGQNIMRLWGPTWMNLDQHDALDFFDKNGVVVRRTGIFDGEGANYGLVTVVEENGKKVKKPRMALFDRWSQQLDAQIRGERNHPSIMIWSIENEITYINSRNLGNATVVEPVIRDVALKAMKVDPTRPVMTDGGDALLDHSLPVNGCHYPETAQRDYPTEAYTLDKEFHEKHFWTYDITKPGFFGESYFVTGNPPSWLAGIQGQSAFLGRAAAARGAAIMGKMLSEGYRWVGLGAFQLWMNDTTDTMYSGWKPVAVLVRQWNWTFGSGTKVDRTLKVLNDTEHASPIDVKWEFSVDGKSIQQEDKSYDVAPGTAQQFSITLNMPIEQSGRHAGKLILTASRDGKEVFHDEKSLVVINPDEAAKPNIDKADLVVFDPKGNVKARLNARGIAFTEVANVNAIPATAKVIVIGNDALTPAESTSSKWIDLAANGARIIILEQDNPLHYQALPADLDPTDFVGRIAFADSLDNPIFNGLAQEDFFTWPDQSIVYRNCYMKATHGARSLVQCEPELACSAMVECPVNSGLIIPCQLVVGETLATNPVAQRLFDNTVDYAADYLPPHKQTALAFDVKSPWTQMLAHSGLKFDHSDDVMASITDGKHDIVVAEATPDNLKNIVAHMDQLHAFTDRGGYLMLCDLTPEGLSDFNKIVGVEHSIRPFESERVTLASPNDPMMAGLTSRDVVMESGEKIASYSGDKFLAGDVFTNVVDLDDIAPFCQLPGPDYWLFPDAKPGADHWPRNMVNGFTSADSWKLAFTMAWGNGAPTKWTMTLPREETITEFDIQPTKIFNKIDHIDLYFDDDKTPVTLQLKDIEGRQDLTVPPHKATKLTVDLGVVKDPIKAAVGIDNLWIKIARPADFDQKVKPMLNIGALVRYPMGKGGVILNELRVSERESVPVNAQKKQAIVTTILHNLGAMFSGGKVITIADMKFTPIPFNEQANAYLTKDHESFGDVDLSTFPVGQQKLDGVTYQINDVKTSPVPAAVMIHDSHLRKLAETVSIKVDKKADDLFFLQAYIERQKWTNRPKTAPVVFDYLVTYDNGKTETIPVTVTEGIANYVNADASNLKDATVAWTGAAATPGKEQLIVYQMRWANPHPDQTIKTVTLERADGVRPNWGAPVWIGLTAANTAK